MTKRARGQQLGTIAVHGGEQGNRRDVDAPVVQPLYQSVNFIQEIGSAEGLRYPRYGNAPNAETVQRRIAALERAEASVLLASGMGATACALLGLGFVVVSLRRLRHRRLAGGAVHGTAALLCFLVALGLALVGASLLSYERLTFERPALRASFARAADGQFNATLTYPSGEVRGYVLRGDEWQIDARVLKWRGAANMLGFDTIYRLERIGGRYTDVERERTLYSHHG